MHLLSPCLRRPSLPATHTRACSEPPNPPPCLHCSPSSQSPGKQQPCRTARHLGPPFSPSPASLKWLQDREVSLAPETRIEVRTAAARQSPRRGHVHICAHETGQSSCSHGVEGVLCSRTAWEPVWSSKALRCSGSPILHSSVKSSEWSTR